MRKLILFVFLLPAFFVQSQTWDDDMIVARGIVDSLKKELKTAKGDKKIDCLNLLSQTYEWIWDDNIKHLDSACMYSEQAYGLAKNSNYKRGLGYAVLGRASCLSDRADEDQNNKNLKPTYLQANKLAQEAIQIGEEIKDYRLVADAYNTLRRVEGWNGDRIKFKEYVEKAIFYYEKPVTKKLTAILNISECDQCHGNERRLGDLYQILGSIAWNENNSKGVKESMNKVIHYYEMIGNKKAIGSMYSFLRQAYFRVNNYKASEEAGLKAISYFQEANDKESEVNQMNEMCKVYEITGEFEKGLLYGKRSIEIAEILNKNRSISKITRRSSGQAFFWMCRLYKIAGDYETALDIIRRGRNFYPDPIDSIAKGLWSAEIGDVHRLLGKYDSALYYLKPFEKTPDDGNNFGKIALGYLYLDLKEYDKALQIADPFYSFLKKFNRSAPPQANCLMIAGSALYGEKKYREALEKARLAQTHLTKMDGRVLMITNYKLLSDIFSKLNINDSAYYYLTLHTSLKDSLINRQLYFRLKRLKSESEEQKKTSQINILNKDNQLKNQQLKQQAQLRNFLLLGLLALTLIAAFIYRNLSLKRKNDKLKNEQIHAQLKQRTSELEMQALRAQMNPHFIFNCLSSINRFILKNETEAASDYLTRFSRLIRMVLIHSQSERIVLKDELEMLRLYLDMEQLRFKNTFDYNISFTNSIDPEVIFIPPLLLQPFCENAIWHGLMHKDERGYLEIELSLHNDYLNCIISDNGVGRKKAAEIKSRSGEMHKSVGLKITAERLALMNEENSSTTSYYVEDIIDWDGNIAGTRVNLNIRVKDPSTETVKEPAI